ncbi:MAG: hypothetical protein J6W42_05165 [Bacteroidaceae bacterium]|nr:hypothetical protein [Bacteroidaceae bacterium]
MKKVLVFLTIGVFIISCGENIEQKAGHHLDNAKEAFSIGNYNVAKQEIDSIRILYPKAFETRRQGIKLMQLIEEAEQLRIIEYEDSMIAGAQAAFDKIKADYAFEKDERYQDVGLYTIKSQAPQRNTDRTYIRAQVDELGRMTLVSSYRGSSYIHHDWLKLSVGEFYVDTPESKDRHEFTDLGICYERLSFINGNDGGAAAFISANKDADITYTLYRKTGPESSRAVYKNLKMTKDDRYAIAQLYDLSQVLLSLNEHKSLRDEADRHLKFIRSKMKEEVSAEEAVQEDK